MYKINTKKQYNSWGKRISIDYFIEIKSNDGSYFPLIETVTKDNISFKQVRTFNSMVEARQFIKEILIPKKPYSREVIETVEIIELPQ